MAEEGSQESTREVEVFGELGLMPKVGVKVRWARKQRVDRAIAAAADSANVPVQVLQDRLTASSDNRVRDVLVTAALRAEQVDDDEYLDVLGRLIAGALDAASIDEIAYLTAEVTRLEPLHLRALFGFFHYGEEGNEAADPSLSPAGAHWAQARPLDETEVARRLKVSRETTSQVLLRLDRDGFLERISASDPDDDAEHYPSDWAAKTLSVLFPHLKVEINEGWPGSEHPESSTEVLEAVPTPSRDGAPEVVDTALRDRRVIVALEDEIKKAERERYSVPRGLRGLGDSSEWLAAMKRRLRRVDPDNPWAYDDYD